MLRSYLCLKFNFLFFYFLFLFHLFLYKIHFENFENFSIIERYVLLNSYLYIVEYEF